MKRSDFVKWGSEGGKLGASRMTPKERSERAKKAVKARQAKLKKARESQ